MVMADPRDISMRCAGHRTNPLQLKNTMECSMVACATFDIAVLSGVL